MYSFGSIKATLKWVGVIKPELEKQLRILNVALGKDIPF
jgi:hypothetical protein